MIHIWSFVLLTQWIIACLHWTHSFFSLSLSPDDWVSAAQIKVKLKESNVIRFNHELQKQDQIQPHPALCYVSERGHTKVRQPISILINPFISMWWASGQASGVVVMSQLSPQTSPLHQLQTNKSLGPRSQRPMRADWCVCVWVHWCSDWPPSLIQHSTQVGGMWGVIRR